MFLLAELIWCLFKIDVRIKKNGNVTFVVTLIFTGSAVQARLTGVQKAAASNRIIVHPDKGQRARTPPPRGRLGQCSCTSPTC